MCGWQWEEEMGPEDCGFFQRIPRLLKARGTTGRQMKEKEEEYG